MTREESDIILDQIKTYSSLMLKDYVEFLPFGIIVFDRTTPQVLMLDHENSSIFDHIEENMRYIEKQVLDKKATSGAVCYLIKYGEMDAIMFKMIADTSNGWVDLVWPYEIISENIQFGEIIDYWKFNETERFKPN